MRQTPKNYLLNVTTFIYVKNMNLPFVKDFRPDWVLNATLFYLAKDSWR